MCGAGLLEAILARLRLSETSLAKLQSDGVLRSLRDKEVWNVWLCRWTLPRQFLAQAGLVARVEKLEIEVDALLNDEMLGSGCLSPRSQRSLAQVYQSWS